MHDVECLKQQCAVYFLAISGIADAFCAFLSVEEGVFTLSGQQSPKHC